MEYKNTELEIAVLGSIINNGELYFKVSDILTRDCFTDYVNQELYTCIVNAINESGEVSKVQLLHKFTDVMGGDGEQLKQNFVEIVSASSGAAFMGIRGHAKTLVELKQSRQLKELLEVAQKRQIEHPIELASEILNNITKIITDSPQDNSVFIKDAFSQIYDEVSQDEPTYQAPTGIYRLDCAMNGGLQRGRVYSFLAPAKCGKTMLATTISNNLCDSNYKHLFICAEMGSREVSMRMLGQRIGLPTNVFTERKDEQLKQQLAEQITKINNTVIFENEPAIEFDRLKVLIERHCQKNKIDGFILDYYQLVTGQERHETQAQHLEKIANWIHKTCKKNDIWCILLVQANDEGKILGSRGLDRACDQKYMIQRPLDSEGDPIGSTMWLKMKLSRYTKLCGLGTIDNPTLQIHHNGTHIEEI